MKSPLVSAAFIVALANTTLAAPIEPQEPQLELFKHVVFENLPKFLEAAPELIHVGNVTTAAAMKTVPVFVDMGDAVTAAAMRELLNKQKESHSPPPSEATNDLQPRQAQVLGAVIEGAVVPVIHFCGALISNLVNSHDDDLDEDINRWFIHQQIDREMREQKAEELRQQQMGQISQARDTMCPASAATRPGTVATDGDKLDTPSKPLAKRLIVPKIYEDYHPYTNPEDRWKNVAYPGKSRWGQGDVDHEYGHFGFSEKGTHPDGDGFRNELLLGSNAMWGIYPTVKHHKDVVRAKEESAKKEQLQKAALLYHNLKDLSEAKAEKEREAAEAAKAIEGEPAQPDEKTTPEGQQGHQSLHKRSIQNDGGMEQEENYNWPQLPDNRDDFWGPNYRYPIRPEAADIEAGILD